MSWVVDKLNSFVLKMLLRAHSFSYRLAGSLAQRVERDGLHPKHRLMNYHKFFVDNVSKSDSVLDIGCGNGALTYDVARKAKKVVAIDLNEENIEIAREKYSAPNIRYLRNDITKELPDKKFDLIVLSNVLEHIENRVEFLRRIEDLAPKILIRVPIINRDWITLYKKELGMEWRLDPTHYTEYTLESFKEELQKADLNLDNYSVQFGEIWAVVKK